MKKINWNNPEEVKEYRRLYYRKNRDKLLSKQNEIYNSEKRKEYQLKYYQEHKEKYREYREKNKEKYREYRKEYSKKRYQDNREKILESKKQFYKEHKQDYKLLKKARARNLVNSYIFNDEKHNRGECTLTPQWIVDNIFSGQNCHYCNESDWTKLGVDRIDNSKPHTPDNVVPCCKECNLARQQMKYEDFKSFFE